MSDLHELVDELADVLWRIEGNYHREGTGPGSRFEGQRLEVAQAKQLVRMTLEFVARDGRPVVEIVSEAPEAITHPSAVDIVLGTFRAIRERQAEESGAESPSPSQEGGTGG